MVTCPKCNADIDFEEEDLDEGERFLCEECGVQLVVTSVSPLDLAIDTEDDDEDEDDEELEDEEEDEEEEDDEDEWE